uniref:Uncharacterized protein n=1 Tax=Janibacter limosus TaxID=53458 RepID=A0AC61U919_9MICO|nr:hypothetical protein [Janibacter limosus]
MRSSAGSPPDESDLRLALHPQLPHLRAGRDHLQCRHWMGRVAQDWVVLTELTDHSASALGIVTGLQFLPMLLLAPLDRSRR